MVFFPEDDRAAAFVAICSCASASPPFPTKDEAIRWATGHGAEVSDDVEVLSEEGGVGWSCMFCGSQIEQAPLRISVRWTDDGVDGEQWYAAHRECLLQRLSPDEVFASRFAG